MRLHWHSGGGAGFVAFGLLLLALMGVIAGVIWRLLKAANTDLVANDFGLCPGIRQPYASGEGFTDWLARLIDEAAGIRESRSPAHIRRFGRAARGAGRRFNWP